MAPMYLDIARTALLHLQQQQQCILQSPAADLTAINMICGDLGAAVELANSTPAGMAEVKQQLRDAAPVLLRPLGNACQALAHELQQALKQQQQPLPPAAAAAAAAPAAAAIEGHAKRLSRQQPAPAAAAATCAAAAAACSRAAGGRL
uniref:Uncharacterized protein n=1 Tax=Tetradesmus obliquus TaxID=3088 RepID=A0A383VQ76_TETOB|eukprot:jgi/Sobl393_1/8536/SZX66556.1